MLELVWPMDLLRGACIYGRRAYELAPAIASKVENPIVVDIRPWEWKERWSHECIAGKLLEWLDLDLLAEALSIWLNVPKGAIGALLSKFYRMTPSPTLFGLSGFLDSLETADIQMRGACERIKEVVISLSSIGKAEELPDRGPAFIDLSKVGWEAPRCLLYSALLRQFSIKPPSATLILSGLEVLGKSAKLWGLVESLFERVPILAFCEFRPPIEFFTMIKIFGERFELVRGGIYSSVGQLKLERIRFEEGGMRGDLSSSRDAYMILKALDKDGSTVEGLKGYLPMIAVDEVLFALEEAGYVKRDGKFVRITERGLEQLGRLEEIYG